MSEENVDKARAFIAAYNRRDFDAAVKSFDPEIDWILPERQSSDSCRGPDEIKRFWEGIDETFDELRLVPQEFVDAGDRVATRLRHHGKGKRSGLEIDEEMYHQGSDIPRRHDRADGVLRRMVRGAGRRRPGGIGRLLTPTNYPSTTPQ